jgi:D-alanyl-D-alanine carboxypeptidase (penicillin-binding protein 5/6)
MNVQIKLWSVVMALAILVGCAVPARAHDENGAEAPLKVHSRYAVLVDAATGQVLWGRNADAKRPMASTTKIMTAILLLERGKLDDIVFGPKGIDKVEESSLHLSPGEQIPLRDLLYALMLRSANDTAIAGACYLSGSVPAFAAEMNAKARDIGALNTHFVTPNGLYAPGHYSTAADLARMASYAVNNIPMFSEIVRTKTYKVHRSMHKGDTWVRNTAMTFLKKYPGGDGIKTGYIRQAGHCFVGSATQGGWRLIAVALDSPICRQDVEAILTYGFANFTRAPAVDEGASLGAVAVPSATAPVPAVAAKKLMAVIPRGKAVPKYDLRLVPLAQLPAAPFPAGTKLGTYQLVANGRVKAAGDAVAAAPAEAKPAIALAPIVGHAAKHGLRWLAVIAGLVVLAALARFAMQYFSARPKKGDKPPITLQVRR